MWSRSRVPGLVIFPHKRDWLGWEIAICACSDPRAYVLIQDGGVNSFCQNFSNEDATKRERKAMSLDSEMAENLISQGCSSLSSSLNDSFDIRKFFVQHSSGAVPLVISLLICFPAFTQQPLLLLLSLRCMPCSLQFSQEIIAFTFDNIMTIEPLSLWYHLFFACSKFPQKDKSCNYKICATNDPTWIVIIAKNSHVSTVWKSVRLGGLAQVPGLACSI